MTKKKTPAKKKRPTTQKSLNHAAVMRDLHNTLRSHGITSKIASMEIPNVPQCTCPDGRPGVLRVVGGKLVCVCD